MERDECESRQAKSGNRAGVGYFRSVTQLGGTYAMEDTDCLAIISTQKGDTEVLPKIRTTH